MCHVPLEMLTELTGTNHEKPELVYGSHSCSNTARFFMANLRKVLRNNCAESGSEGKKGGTVSCTFFVLQSLAIYYYYYYYYYYSIIVSFMQGSHTHNPETNHVPRGYIVAAILSLFFMVPLCLVPALVLCSFTLTLSEVCVHCPIWLFSVVP